MAARSYQRGHEVVFDGRAWVHGDDGSPVGAERGCKGCGRYPTPDGHDACLGKIDGAVSACCGHGIAEQAFVFLLGWEDEMDEYDVSTEPILIEGSDDRGLLNRLDEATDWPFPLYVVIGIYSVMTVLLLAGWGVV